MTDDVLHDLIGAYIDDDLPAPLRREVEARLLASPELAWEAMSLRIARERLRAEIGETTASDAFRSRALRRIVADNPHLAPDPEPDTPGPEQYRLPMGI